MEHTPRAPCVGVNWRYMAGQKFYEKAKGKKFEACVVPA